MWLLQLCPGAHRGSNSKVVVESVAEEVGKAHEFAVMMSQEATGQLGLYQPSLALLLPITMCTRAHLPQIMW